MYRNDSQTLKTAKSPEVGDALGIGLPGECASCGVTQGMS
jgi:hypothetical protein